MHEMIEENCTQRRRGTEGKKGLCGTEKKVGHIQCHPTRWKKGIERVVYKWNEEDERMRPSMISVKEKSDGSEGMNEWNERVDQEKNEEKEECNDEYRRMG